VSDLFLGVIAVAVLIMATIQVAAIVFAIRAARRVGEAVSRLEQNVQPIVANLQTLSADAVRATSVAATQVERAQQLITDLTRRVEDIAQAVESGIVKPAREGLAVIQGILAAFAAFRPDGTPSARKRPVAAEEEDPLFIG
jgi:hypothetical protein